MVFYYLISNTVYGNLFIVNWKDSPRLINSKGSDYIKHSKRKTFKILSIDGGGMRGVYPAHILKYNTNKGQTYTIDRKVSDLYRFFKFLTVCY